MVKLSEEIKAYEIMESVLKADHPGKWVIIHEKKLIGAYDEFEKAADVAVQKFGSGPYLIRQVGSKPITLPASLPLPSCGKPCLK